MLRLKQVLRSPFSVLRSPFSVSLAGLFCALVILPFTNCSNGSTDPVTPPLGIQGVDVKGSGLRLIDSPDSSRAFSGGKGASYELRVTEAGANTAKISTGTIADVSNGGNTLTLQPSRSGSSTFTITLNGSGEMETLHGTITFTDGSTYEAVENKPSPIAAVPALKEYPFDGAWQGEIDGGDYYVVFGKNAYSQIYEAEPGNLPKLVRGQIGNITENALTILDDRKYNWTTGKWEESEAVNASGTYTITNNGNTFTIYGDISEDPINGQVLHRQIIN